MAMKIAALAQGYSGVRGELVDLMVTMFNHDLLPAVPSQGSVGASGDLTPLAHVAAAMMGEGRIIASGQLMPASAALAAHGIAPLKLRPKEGLALLNRSEERSVGKEGVST